MSEATLYAMDAPRVKSADAAADFLEKWQDSTKAPTARIAAFFERLLQTWSADGPGSAIWYEGFDHNPPAGQVLAMAFALREFDTERLQQLRAMAQAHGVHIFDPEGHVLYLADGSEARAPSLAAPEPGAPSQCISGVRFDGVYETKREKGWTYLCFTADGKIFWQSTGGRFQARAAMDSFATGDSFIVKGTYKPAENAFSARLKASFGAFKMNGVLKEDGLHVHSERTNGSYPFDSVYTFLPL
ncbi:hypothetical protein [Acidovorax sp. Q11]